MDKARQENQLAVRYKAVLGFGAKLAALCQARQYGQVLPAYEQATAVIQAQAAAASHVDWSVLHTLMDQVSLLRSVACSSNVCHTSRYILLSDLQTFTANALSQPMHQVSR